jgi:hypothetical protein
MSKRKRHVVRARCPECACGSISDVPMKVYEEKYNKQKKVAEIFCPMCGTKHTGVLEEIEEEDAVG